MRLKIKSEIISVSSRKTDMNLNNLPLEVFNKSTKNYLRRKRPEMNNAVNVYSFTPHP